MCLVLDSLSWVKPFPSSRLTAVRCPSGAADPPPQTPQQQDRDGVVPSELAVLKYVHALPCTTQCDSVEEQRRACGAGIFFVYDQQSGWTWPLDKDPVCGMMLVWCPPAWPVGGD